MELFDAPDNRVALRSILHRANRRLEGWGVSVRWDRDHDLDVVRCGTLLELRLGLDHVLNSTVRMRLDYSLYPNEGLHLPASDKPRSADLGVRSRTPTVALQRWAENRSTVGSQTFRWGGVSRECESQLGYGRWVQQRELRRMLRIIRKTPECSIGTTSTRTRRQAG